MRPTTQFLRRIWERCDGNLRARILLPTSLLFAATLAIMVAAAIQIEGAEIERVAREHANLSANLIARTVAGTLAENPSPSNRDVLAEALEVVGQRHSDLVSVNFLSPSGEVQLSTRPDWLRSQPWPKSKLESSLLVQPSEYVAIRPVLVSPCLHCSAEPSVAGWLDLRFSRADPRQARHRLAWTLGLLALPSLLALLAIAWWLLGREAVGPLRRLIAAMRTAEGGRKEVVADEGRPDELGVAARGFDSVLSALRKSRAELEAVYRARMERADRFALMGEVATGLAHEIKNPLAGLSGALEILSEDFSGTPDHAETAATIEEMRRQVRRLASTMEGLLSFARPNKQETNLNQCLEAALFLIERQRRSARVRVVRDLVADVPLVLGDAGQLQQVFLNLCLNAWQAMDGSGGGTLTARTFHSRGGQVTVEICDTGPGIPAEVRPHIFKPFYTTRSDGNGLGLAVSERIVAEHGGEIAFRCPPEGGTIFSMTLPRAVSLKLVV
jgi:signal transduction histidine kinase